MSLDILLPILPVYTDLIPPQYALSSLGSLVKKYIESIPEAYSNVFVDNYVIMPNHVHLLLRIDTLSLSDVEIESRRPTVMTIIRALKSLTVRQVGFPFWQDSFYEHVIRRESDYQDIWNYISDNPRKWADDTYFVE